MITIRGQKVMSVTPGTVYAARRCGEGWEVMKRVPIGIERNRHPAGRRWNFAFGAAEVVDGLVRVLSFGFLHTRWPVDVSRKQTEAMFRKLKAARAAHATQPKEARGNGEHRAVRGRDEVGD